MCFKAYVAGSYFGELEIFRKCNRLFNIRCEEDSTFMTIDRDYFLQLLKRYPNVETEMRSMAHMREIKIAESL